MIVSMIHNYSLMKMKLLVYKFYIGDFSFFWNGICDVIFLTFLYILYLFYYYIIINIFLIMTIILKGALSIYGKNYS